MLNVEIDWEEVDSLITILREKGVSYLLGNGLSADKDNGNIDPVSLIRRLAACGFPLVEYASISLFILHPELAPSVMEAYQGSEDDIAENIAIVTLATLYLQEWWLFRLTFALGHLPSFPQEPFMSLWEERHLPPPSSGYGRDGFLELQEYQQKRYSAPLNFLHDWQNQINHLLAQEEAKLRELPDDVREALRKIIEQKESVK